MKRASKIATLSQQKKSWTETFVLNFKATPFSNLRVFFVFRKVFFFLNVKSEKIVLQDERLTFQFIRDVGSSRRVKLWSVRVTRSEQSPHRVHAVRHLLGLLHAHLSRQRIVGPMQISVSAVGSGTRKARRLLFTPKRRASTYRIAQHVSSEMQLSVLEAIMSIPVTYYISEMLFIFGGSINRRER